MPARSVLVLGGGIAGVPVALHLRRKLAPEDTVTVVEARATHEFRPTLLAVAIGAAGPAQARRGWEALARQNIEVVTGRIESIDPVRRAVVVDGRTLTADALVVALGAEMAPEGIPGLDEAGCLFHRTEGAEQAARGLVGLRQGRLAVVSAPGPYPCPLAPHEYAMLADHELRRRGVRRQVEVALYTADPGPMPEAAPAVAEAVAHWLRAKDVAYHPGTRVVEVHAADRRLRFSDGSSEDFDLLVAVPPHVPPAVVRDSALAGPDGWIPVDLHTCETAFANVFAIGDVTAVRLPSRGTLPKQGVFAHAQARAVAQTLAARLRVGGAEGRFDGQGEFFVEVGGGLAGLVCAHLYALPDPAVLIMHPAPQWHAARRAVAANWWTNYFEG